MADPYGLELSGLTPELSAEAAALARRQKVAEAMGMQAQQGLPVNRMAGNMAVSISPFEGAAQLMRAYSSRKALDDVDSKRQDIARRGREAVTNEVARIRGIAEGTPGSTTTNVADDQLAYGGAPEDSTTTQVVTPGVPGDPRRALFEAAGSTAPQAGRLAGVIQAMMPKTAKWEKAELPNADGTTRTGWVDVNSANPEATFRSGGTKPAETTGLNGQLVVRATGARVGEQVAPPLAQDSIVKRDAQGNLVENTPVTTIKGRLAERGATRVNQTTNVDTGKKFYEELQKAVGDQVATTASQARSAVGTLNTVGQIREALDTGRVIAGPGTTARQFLGQIGQVIGIAGKDATDQLVQTRKAVQGLAQLELDAAQQMKGQGQITEAERAIIKRAAAGDIDGMSVVEIRMLTGVMDRSARYKITTNAENVARLRKQPGAQSVVDYIDIPMPPPYAGAAPATAAPATAAPQTGGVLRFDAQGNPVR
jgi:hypothetical protein